MSQKANFKKTQGSQQSQEISETTSYQQDIKSFQSKSESVKVCLRIRPMIQMELQRGDENCIKVTSQNKCEINIKTIQKQFNFSQVFNQQLSQEDIFTQSNVTELLLSALEGYSATIFAYGQTGSGKTYTMAGIEEKLSQEKYISDSTEGIIPRAFRQLWNIISSRQEKFFIKASFTEIYNEQIFDLLNPGAGILHTRQNAQNGFFVEDLMVVECTSIDDLVAVLHEGNKNRKVGCHEMNKDSSRSHSLLHVYIISEISQNNQISKRYGKISFVDLAGSERLKESKAQGDMVKETGNINKSLFTLGKVISSLTSKQKDKFIPYRDSKLTMLLMDSLGGNSKALMIACVSPSSFYFDETLSTLNYAQRTMNIKNKPIIQMEPKDQIIFNLNQDLNKIKQENQYLREQLKRASKGQQIEMPQFFPNQKSNQLPSLNSGMSFSKQDIPLNKIAQEYQQETGRLKKENQELQNAKELAEQSFNDLNYENEQLQIKLQNLQNVFIGRNLDFDKPENELKQNENDELRQQIKILEQQNEQITNLIDYNKNNHFIENQYELIRLKEINEQKRKKFEKLQIRERELMNTLKQQQQ